MNENIDLTKILKGCEGMKFYYSIRGINVKLVKIMNPNETALPIRIEDEVNNIHYGLNRRGASAIESEFPNAECMLFPSKDQRDWSRFEKPIPIDTPMVVFNTWDEECSNNYKIRYYARFENGKHNVYYYNSLRNSNSMIMSYDVMIPFDKFNPNDIEESLKYNIQK